MAIQALHKRDNVITLLLRKVQLVERQCLIVYLQSQTSSPTLVVKFHYLL